MATDKHEQIRRRAYEIWEDEGRPEGAAMRHWMQASDELEDNEHETLQDLIDEDDRDDEAMPDVAGESGDFGRMPPRSV